MATAFAGSILLPFGHAARRGFEPVTELTDPRLWGGIALLAGAAWVSVRSWRGERYALVAIAWSLAVLLPTLVVPIPIIQRQLGHTSLQTTDTYLSHIAPKQVLEVITSRSWGAP